MHAERPERHAGKPIQPRLMLEAVEDETVDARRQAQSAWALIEAGCCRQASLYAT